MTARHPQPSTNADLARATARARVHARALPCYFACHLTHNLAPHLARLLGQGCAHLLARNLARTGLAWQQTAGNPTQESMVQLSPVFWAEKLNTPSSHASTAALQAAPPARWAALRRAATHAAHAATIVALAICLLPASARAQAQRLDDSASPRQQVPVSWQSSSASQLSGTVQTEYRLVTSAYLGRTARVYLVLPALVPGVLRPSALRMQWRGQGVLGAGSAQLGERVLVWSGKVSQPWLSDTLSLRMDVDPNGIRLPPGMPFRFEPYFEIEPLP